MTAAAAARWLAEASPAAGGLPDAVGLGDLARFAHALASALPPPSTSIACARGCAACCHQRILVTPPDVVLLLPALRQRVVRVRLRRLAVRGVHELDPFQGWLAGRIACPLLSETGECDAYGSRPAACREHLAQSDPAACWDPGGLGVDLVVPLPRFSAVLAVACSLLRGGVDERIPLDGALAWARGHRRLLSRRWSRARALAAFEMALAREG